MSLATLLVTLAGGWAKRKLAELRADDAPMGDQLIHDTGIQITRVLNRIMTRFGCLRVLVLKERDGVASVKYEVYQGKTLPIQDSFQNQPLDRHYLGLIDDVRRHGMARLVTEEMPDDALLKPIYRRSGVGWSCVIKIIEIDGLFYYLSLVFNGQTRVEYDDDDFRDLTRVATNRLRILVSSLYHHQEPRPNLQLRRSTNKPPHSSKGGR